MQADIMFNPTDCEIKLQRDQHMRLSDAQGWKIKAVDGTVWITQEGDSRDIVLRNGESFVFDRAGKVLLSALDRAVLCVKRTAHAPLAAA